MSSNLVWILISEILGPIIFSWRPLNTLDDFVAALSWFPLENNSLGHSQGVQPNRPVRYVLKDLIQTLNTICNLVIGFWMMVGRHSFWWKVGMTANAVLPLARWVSLASSGLDPAAALWAHVGFVFFDIRFRSGPRGPSAFRGILRSHRFLKLFVAWYKQKVAEWAGVRSGQRLLAFLLIDDSWRQRWRLWFLFVGARVTIFSHIGFPDGGRYFRLYFEIGDYNEWIWYIYNLYFENIFKFK